MQLSAQQLKELSTNERREFVFNVINELDAKYSEHIKQKETLTPRLTEALDYAISLDIKDPNLLRSLLYLEASTPGLSTNPALREALEETEDSEQRYRDIMNAAINVAMRG